MGVAMLKDILLSSCSYLIRYLLNVNYLSLNNWVIFMIYLLMELLALIMITNIKILLILLIKANKLYHHSLHSNLVGML